MKMYFEPITTALQLSSFDRLCDTEVTSVGGNGGLTNGGEGQENWNPM